MTCVTSPAYCLTINGGTHGFIHGKRGLRQGDPMSPTLFLLCMEYLSRSIAKRTKELDFSFHPRCDLFNITHIAFADDLLLFCRGDARSVKILAMHLTISRLNLASESTSINPRSSLGELEISKRTKFWRYYNSMWGNSQQNTWDFH